MKSILLRYLIVPGLTALALVFATASASAQEKPEKAPKGPGKATLKKYDADGDGQLNDAEKAAHQAENKARREAREADRLAKYDADHDGKLSAEEREKMKADHQAEAEAHKAAAAEKKAAAEARKAERADKKDKEPN